MRKFSVKRGMSAINLSEDRLRCFLQKIRLGSSWFCASFHTAAALALGIFAFSHFLLSAPLLSSFAHAADDGENFTVRRDFRGVVRRDMAERAMRIAAESQAMDRAVLLLAKERSFAPASSFASGPGRGKERGHNGPSLDGLARSVFKVNISSVTLAGFPPSVQVVAEVRLTAPEDMQSALQTALERRDLIEINSRVLIERRRLLNAYDALAARLLPLNPAKDGGMEELHALQRICHEMDAVEIFSDQLSRLGIQWKEPEIVHRELVKARNLAPGNVLVKTALAEVLLQLDRPVAALEEVGGALKQAPDYARAHDVRGAILLRQRLFSLAVESFSRAVALSPGNSAYLVHRASAYLVLGEAEGMCEDFIEACGMGDCEGLEWARGAGKCGVKGIEGE